MVVFDKRKGGFIDKRGNLIISFENGSWCCDELSVQLIKLKLGEKSVQEVWCFIMTMMKESLDTNKNTDHRG